MKILTILGARPQFIKAAAVSRAISDQSGFEEMIIHTGQHYDYNMSSVFFEQLDIPKPDYNLEISNLSHGAMTARMLEGLEAAIINQKPDCVLVYGDTNSTLAGALAASKLHVPVAHVEAGLRSKNMKMPEEVNRVLTDRVSSILFCPTQTATFNLYSEGYPFLDAQEKRQVVLDVGDVMYDATLYYKDRAMQEVSLEYWSLTENNYILFTLHREENTNDLCRLESILSAVKEVSREVIVLFPCHPRTKALMDKVTNDESNENFKITEPLPYLEMQRLLMGAQLLMTDSGGMQKEAYFHQVPCVTLRNETEWQETISTGWNQLVGANKKKIVSAALQAEIPIKKQEQPFGDGTAAYKIIDELGNI